MMDALCSDTDQGGGLDILTQELGKFWLDAADHQDISMFSRKKATEIYLM